MQKTLTFSSQGKAKDIHSLFSNFPLNDTSKKVLQATLNFPNSPPLPNLEVRAHATLLHCSTTGGWCLQLASISRAVFQYGGVGKQRAHASSHTSNSTAISFSASFSATPTETGCTSLITFPVIVHKHREQPPAATIPPTVGGASNVSLTRSRKSSSTSQVSLTMETDSRASFWTAVRTCWHNLMWFRLCCSGLQGSLDRRKEQKQQQIKLV